MGPLAVALAVWLPKGGALALLLATCGHVCVAAARAVCLPLPKSLSHGSGGGQVTEGASLRSGGSHSLFPEFGPGV